MTIVYDANGRAFSEKNPVPTKGVESQYIQPVDVQARYSQTIQTHNAVSVGASSWSLGSWVEVSGFDKLGVTVLNDAVTNNSFTVHWSNDGTNQHGQESVSPSADKYRASEISVKAKYVKLNLKNDDTIAHTMSAWLYAKV
jgi:hypothetical protein